jgi:DNA-binding CsgD family transcriptional regulator
MNQEKKMLKFEMDAPTAGLEPVLRVLLNHIDCGLIVCDGQAKVRVANAAAGRALQDGSMLRLSGDVLRCVTGESDAFDQAVRQAAQKGRRHLLGLAVGDQRLMVSVVPLATGDGHAPWVLIVLGRGACSPLGLEMFGSAHGLTLAERRVLAALVDAHKPREVAQALGVALSTVRCQIKAIHQKLGVHSTEALLLRAAEIPPVAAAIGASAAAWRHGSAPELTRMAA